ncbi:hypothetical protein TCE0_023f07239 [Talaromyces pinophilus]|uniref:DUF1479-domain-containing protein n=1 Tax=Talaromyces pinophilus TaxID=128442 RepID=A0A0B8MXU0_TALPI|nr:hypothetical protein TCE0_023f07239 [Talaromyces pinophilus]
MPGVLKTWPAWPEYTKQTEVYAQEPSFLRAKQEVIAQYGKDAICKSWLKTCQALESVTKELEENGASMIPTFDAEKVINDGFTPSEKDYIKSIGCFIVRQVIPEDEVREQYAKLQEYISANREQVKGWPVEAPSMLRLYDSPTQINIRTHPNHLNVQRKLNELWHDESGETSAEPLLYSDGIRDRPPQTPFMGLPPHIDAGSLSRWADKTYREAYHHIFSGSPELHDAYDLNARKNADQYLFPGVAHSRVFRAFQGWTALTPAAPRSGSILLFPHIQMAVAYVLLRPFFRPPESGDIMDASKWTFDADQPWFPGTFLQQSQLLSRSSHPHLRLEDCLVASPSMRPGDSVWWHSDMIHAVDTEHLGQENAAAVFIPACPTTPINKEYIKTQKEASLAGRPPPDYVFGAGSLNETLFKGYEGFERLSDEAKIALGF